MDLLLPILPWSHEEEKEDSRAVSERDPALDESGTRVGKENKPEIKCYMKNKPKLVEKRPFCSLGNHEEDIS